MRIFGLKNHVNLQKKTSRILKENIEEGRSNSDLKALIYKNIWATIDNKRFFNKGSVSYRIFTLVKI